MRFTAEDAKDAEVNPDRPWFLCALCVLGGGA